MSYSGRAMVLGCLRIFTCVSPPKNLAVLPVLGKVDLSVFCTTAGIQSAALTAVFYHDLNWHVH